MGWFGFTIVVIAFQFVKTRLSKKDIFCEISIYFNEKKLTTKAMIDTGNMLKDPITGMPVIIVKKEILKDILPNIILDNLTKIVGGDGTRLYCNKNQ